ncbi:CHASE3 domain-containing protein [Neobacillus niacini]|uniref:CHASE3 domain-containing protein n=1 Tax=Neobacillus niacini TaxID=86668 RepID=UPI0021CB4608|nr:CHASE3 domain-containing protein [Neobacillus niacini]MCM3763988.1 CHASE3 domain-containing protein [Neobacillus niacini]
MKGFNYSIHAKIITGYLTILVCLVLSLLIVINRMTALQNEVEFISQHDLEVHNLANQIQKNVLDMETGMRGYVLTGQEEYLEPYHQGNRNWLDNYNKLHSLLKNNSSQQRNLEEIKPLIQNWVTNTGEYSINQKREGKEAELAKHFGQQTGKKVTDQLRTQLTSFLEKEKKLTEERTSELRQNNTNLKITLYAIIILVTVITIATALVLSNSIVKTIKQVVRTIQNITDSKVDLTTRISVKTNDETHELAEAMNSLLGSLEKQQWVQKSMTDISMMYQGITDINELAHKFITRLAPLLNACYGVVYLRRTQGSEVDFAKVAGYATEDDEVAVKTSFRFGEGLVGQAALDQRIFLIDQLPEEHMKVTSGLGASSPRNLLVAPILYEGRVEAVVEFAAMQPFLSQHLTLLDLLQDKFGSSITSVLGRMEVERLLGESQVMTEELQAQSEELQAQSEELQMQQEQLKITNDYLEEQRQFAEQRAYELKKAKDELEEYSRKLQASSQYKSDFLANMSHELRTPLNSILILSQMLMENGADMDEDEVGEYARVINTSGADLLRLIDDILDLSKIEAGKIEILTDEVNVTELPQTLKSLFDPVAAKKNVTFEVVTEPDVPPVISTDGQRLQQILKNLLSNAFKFTEQGSVTVRIALAEAEKIGQGPGGVFEKFGEIDQGPASATEKLSQGPADATGKLGQHEDNVAQNLPQLPAGSPVLAISVTDTGIGIPEDKQQIIFDAFRQVDGTTNRQYGGTGLGLSICREFTRLLGGALEVESEVGKGSTFTLYIPSRLEVEQEIFSAFEEVAAGRVVEDEAEPVAWLEEDSTADEQSEAECSSDDELFNGKKVLLVEDDSRNVFALVTALERKGVTVKVAKNGRGAIEMLRDQADFDLIFMDIMMPVMGGYEAMTIIRGELGLLDLPIIALTAKAMKGERDKCMEAGASDYITKPLNIDQLFSLMRVWLTEQVKSE